MNGSDKFNYHLGCVLLFLAQNWKREKADDWVVVIGSVQLFRCVCVRKHALGLQLSYQIFFTIYIDSCQFFMTSWRCYSRHVIKNIFEDPKAVSACGWACTFHCVQVYACWLLYAVGMINWCYSVYVLRVESPTLIHEVVYVEQMGISVLSGRSKVRGCGWVTLCGRGACSAEMTVIVCKWGEGRGDGKGENEKRKTDQCEVREEKAGSMLPLFWSCFTQCMTFSSSAQLLLVTELIVNWSKEWLKRDS